MEMKQNLIKFRGMTVETINTHTGTSEEKELDAEVKAECAIQKTW